MATFFEHNVTTGKIVVKELTEKEVIDKETQDAATMANRQVQIAAREAVLEKLGITADEANSLLA